MERKWNIKERIEVKKKWQITFSFGADIREGIRCKCNLK